MAVSRLVEKFIRDIKDISGKSKREFLVIILIKLIREFKVICLSGSLGCQGCWFY